MNVLLLTDPQEVLSDPQEVKIQKSVACRGPNGSVELEICGALVMVPQLLSKAFQDSCTSRQGMCQPLLLCHQEFLGCRFPAVGALRKQLQALVHSHAGEAGIQRLGEAFPLLSFGAPASLPDPALRFWAPAALLQVRLLNGAQIIEA